MGVTKKVGIYSLQFIKDRQKNFISIVNNIKKKKNENFQKVVKIVDISKEQGVLEIKNKEC